jgi:hypothetical protein
MSNNFTAEQIVMICIGLLVGGLWISAAIESAKAKAFNEGYKRGRSTLNVREIVK